MDGQALKEIGVLLALKASQVTLDRKALKVMLDQREDLDLKVKRATQAGQ